MGDSGECWVAEGGGGCSSEAPVPCDSDSGSGSPPEDTGAALVAEGGGGCSDCSTLPDGGGGGWGGGLLIMLVVALRRRGPAVLLFLLAWSAPAPAVDAQHLQGGDGGRFATLIEPWRGDPWSLRAAVTTSYAREVVVLRSEEEREVLLDRLWTHEPGASIAAGQHVRLGVSAPVHGPFTYDGEAAGFLRGDMALWVSVHLSDAERPVQRSWTVAADVPSGASVFLLGDAGATRGALASARTLSPQVMLAWQLGARLQPDTELPGISWGRRVEGGLGVDWVPRERGGFTAELLGSGPLRSESTGRAAWPVEATVTARRPLDHSRWIRIGAGAGLTAGIGSPVWRVSLAVYGDDLGADDMDDDGIGDLRDACPEVPEDFDGFRDRDGCPEPDNDLDTILDVDDACPMAAEVFNAYQDEDGCPDALATLTLTVLAAEDLQAARVRIRDRDLTVIPGEPTATALPTGWVELSVQAEGHTPHSQTLRLDQDRALTVTLDPIAWGALALVVTDPRGQPLDAALSDGTPVDTAAPMPMPGGSQELVIAAAGYRPGTLEVTIQPDVVTHAAIVLQPSGPWLEDTRLRTADPIRFALDSDEIDDRSREAVEALAAWLQAHPEVRLLRVEGLADAIGSPAYNHRLSIRRAEAVAAALVDAGVAADRLEPLGTGEALAAPGQPIDAERSVRFLVIVWDGDGIRAQGSPP